MARIRTIKPEFWTDETIVRLPFEARLLFIGIWNFADDSGALEYSPDRIRLQVLPAEHDCDISGLIDLLVAAGLVEYWVDENGTQAITITNWHKHQKIDNPSRKTIIREGYRKKNIPSEARVGVAKKYGCSPGGEVDASCYYCGMPGKVKWWKGSNGKPTRWITLSDLEFDHFVSEHSGGHSAAENIVLACRCCNRGKREFDPHQFFAIKNTLPDGQKKESLDSPSESSPLEVDRGPRTVDQGSGPDSAPPASPAPPPKKPSVPKKSDGQETELQAKCRETWAAYSTAYFDRYGTEPVRNATVNAQVKQFVQRIGAESPEVIRFYLTHDKHFYVSNLHQFGHATKDAEKLRTEWATNRRVSEASARLADRSQSNASAADEAIRMLKEQGVV